MKQLGEINMIAISDQIDIDSREVLLNIGYCTDCKPSARIASFINEYVDNTCNLIEPSYSYVIRDIKSVRGSSISIDGSVTFQSKIIAQLMERCEKVAVFLLTIGNHLEDTVRQMSEDGLILQATVLDAIGSVAAETVADFVQEKVNEVAWHHGLCTSLRFSPGYCDWNIKQQKMVFQAVGGNSTGICLTEDCLMLPRKSISGIIGIGYCNGVEHYNPCETCPNYNCPSRREL
jgi:hypothetical protein